MVKLSPQEVEIRQFITCYFVDLGFAPSAMEIQERFDLSKDETRGILKALAEKKALVLHPHHSEIWLAHPFSNSPNAVWVQSLESDRGWWSNCMWCGMGISALVKQRVKLITRWGGEQEPAEFEISENRLTHSDFIVHMALPVSQLWDNVIHSCSLMLPHRSGISLDSWCQRHRIPKGTPLRASKCLELAQKWYGTFLDKDWNRKSPEEVADFFQSISLDLAFREI